MRVLLDTHIAIWALTTREKLSQTARALIADPQNEIWVSAASIWEISIKFAIGKKNAPPFSGKTAISSFQQAGYFVLDITAAHAAEVGELPLIHGDPFDRLIIAQALFEPMRLLTHDEQVAAYSDTIILD
jgi:PIN domain nuclease of toxin-antitoxin system